MTKRVGVVGLGLIGGSVALALRNQGLVVAGYDADPAVMDAAQRLGLIDEPEDDPAFCAARADVVVLATPAAATLNLLAAVDAAAPPTAMIIDTGSVKAPIVEAMERLPGARRAIGGHPLAGSELSGPRAARAGLFTRCFFLLCPSSRTDAGTVRVAKAFARAVGAMPKVIRADRHDRILARTSHVPQFLSTVLALSIVPGDEALSGPALRDMTRLAQSNPEMWRDIARLNSANLADGLRGIGRRLEKVADLVEQGEGAELEAVLRGGGEAALRIREAAQP